MPPLMMSPVNGFGVGERDADTAMAPGDAEADEAGDNDGDSDGDGEARNKHVPFASREQVCSVEHSASNCEVTLAMGPAQGGILDKQVCKGKDTGIAQPLDTQHGMLTVHAYVSL